MIFNLLIFVVFFAIVLILHAMPFSWRAKKVNLPIANYIFYAAWNPPIVILLWLSTVVDWFCRSRTRPSRPAMEAPRLDATLRRQPGLLCYFKYGHFLVENFAHLAALAGFKYSLPQSNIVLPVGISFYTFAQCPTPWTFICVARSRLTTPRLRVKACSISLEYEPGVIADGDFVIFHGRFSGFGAPANWT
jgi:D-alanyl-lipoteichoic acid acyltransferase DltB (MBOAT superfamily)